MAHYLVLTFAEGKESVRREHIELLDPEESAEAALERWVMSHPDMIDRQRNREKTAAALRASPLFVKIAHPTSWYREQADIQGRPFPSPPGGYTTSRRRRA